MNELIILCFDGNKEENDEDNHYLLVTLFENFLMFLNFINKKIEFLTFVENILNNFPFMYRIDSMIEDLYQEYDVDIEIIEDFKIKQETFKIKNESEVEEEVIETKKRNFEDFENSNNNDLFTEVEDKNKLEYYYPRQIKKLTNESFESNRNLSFAECLNKIKNNRNSDNIDILQRDNEYSLTGNNRLHKILLESSKMLESEENNSNVNESSNTFTPLNYQNSNLSNIKLFQKTKEYYSNAKSTTHTINSNANKQNLPQNVNFNAFNSQISSLRVNNQNFSETNSITSKEETRNSQIKRSLSTGINAILKTNLTTHQPTNQKTTNKKQKSSKGKSEVVELFFNGLIKEEVIQSKKKTNNGTEKSKDFKSIIKDCFYGQKQKNNEMNEPIVEASESKEYQNCSSSLTPPRENIKYVYSKGRISNFNAGYGSLKKELNENSNKNRLKYDLFNYNANKSDVKKAILNKSPISRKISDISCTKSSLSNQTDDEVLCYQTPTKVQGNFKTVNRSPSKTNNFFRLLKQQYKN